MCSDDVGTNHKATLNSPEHSLTTASFLGRLVKQFTTTYYLHLLKELIVVALA
jgi:hypothetical protein